MRLHSIFQLFSSDDLLSRTIELTVGGGPKEFPVLTDTVMVGVLGQAELLKGLQSRGEQVQAGDWTNRDIQSAKFGEPVEKVLEGLRTSHCRLLSVTEANTLAGIVNLDIFIESIKI